MNDYSDSAHARRQPIPVLDLDRPTIARRAELTASLGAGLAACAGVLEWRDIDDETRADMRAVMIRHYVGRLLHARGALCRDPSLQNAQRVERMERGLAAARRLV